MAYVGPWFDDRVNLAIFMGEVSVRKKRYDTRLHSKTSCGLSQCTRRTGPCVKDRCRLGPISIFAPAARRSRPSLTPACHGGCPVRSPHGSDTNFRVAQTRLRI
jgi:hypothetical protein